MLKLDPKHTAGIAPGFSLSEAREDYQEDIDRARESLLARAGAPEAMLGWIHPVSLTEAEQAPIEALSPTITDVVLLGIGGSALGARMGLKALAKGEGRRVHVVDNIEAEYVDWCLKHLVPEHTLVCVVSKSGTTPEIAALASIFFRWLAEALPEPEAQIWLMTDPEDGHLRALAREHSLTSFPIPPSVGGRFSVVTPAALVPLKLAGIDIEQFILGADSASAEAKTGEGMARDLTLIHYQALAHGKHTAVMMPYSSQLAAFGDWFAQLWAESLGKRVNRAGEEVFAGQTPLAARGATDQHSLLQLFAEGPNDKVHTFIKVEEHKALAIPATPFTESELSYLTKHTLQTVLNTELEATAEALAEAGRPSYTITLEKLDARHLGYLCMNYMWATALMGELLNIDAFNQPGVEASKRLTKEKLG